MTSGPNDTYDDEEDGTVIIPAGQPMRPALPVQPAAPTDAATPSSDEEDDTTTVILPADRAARPSAPPAAAPPEARTTPPRPEPPPAPPPRAAVPPPLDVEDEERTAVMPLAEEQTKASESSVAPGTVLGNYRVGKLIARGGLGAIYDGVNVHNPAERVAIKTILPEPGLAERFAKMLLDESNALMRVRHDAVVPYRTYGRIEGTDEFYLVLEFVDGDALNDFYRRRRLNERELFALARRLATGLQAAHQEGLVHRDISPDNVLLQNNQLEKAILIDFGIAKIGGMEDLPDTHFAGKLSYAAPEQFERGGRIGPWTDIYSLALLLIAAARGQPLPMGKTIEEAQEMRRAIPELKGVPPKLIAPLTKMLEPHPADRPQSMIEVITLLDAAEREPSSAPRAKADAAPAPGKGPVRRIEATPKPARRRGSVGRSLISAAIALLVGGAMVAGLMFYSDDIFGDGKPGGGAGTTGTGTPGTGTSGSTGTSGTTGTSTSPGTGGTGTTTPPPPPPAPSRPEQLAKIVSGFHDRLDTNPCTLARIEGSDSGTAFAVAVSGAWGDDPGVRSIAASAGSALNATANVAGEVFDRALCSSADQMKPLASAFGAKLLARPKPTGAPDRSVTVDLTTDALHPFVYLFETDASGRLTQLLDASAAQRGALLADGTLKDAGGGHFGATLKPSTPDANTSQTLLIAVASSDAFTMPSGGLKDFAVAVAGAKALADVVPRDGIAAGPVTPPPPPPPPGKTRPELMAEARAAVLAKLAVVPCSALRIDASDDGQAFTMKVGGVWGDDAAMQTAAADAGTAASTTVQLAGHVVDQALCPSLDGLKKVAPELAAPIFDAPQSSTSGDRATTVSLALPADRPAAYVYEVERDGQVSALADLGSKAARDQAIQSGLAEDRGGGALMLKLVPSSDTANVDSTLLVVLAGTTAPAGFAFAAPADLDGLLHAAAAFDPKTVSIDLAERPGIAPPPPPPPPPGDAFANVRQGFRDLSCSLIRLEQGAGAVNVLGIWSNPKSVQTVADAAGTQLNQTFTLAGDTVSGELCSPLDKLKPFFVDTAPAGLGKAAPTGNPDKSIGADIIADPALANLYVFVVDPGGRIAGIIELSDEAKLAKAVGAGIVQAPGGGRYHIILPPYAPVADQRASLLVTVMSKDKLPAALFGYKGAIAVSGWQKALGEFAKTSQVRIDATPFVPVP